MSNHQATPDHSAPEERTEGSASEFGAVLPTGSPSSTIEPSQLPWLPGTPTVDGQEGILAPTPGANAAPLVSPFRRNSSNGMMRSQNMPDADLEGGGTASLGSFRRLSNNASMRSLNMPASGMPRSRKQSVAASFDDKSFVVQVHVMSTMEHRNALFSSDTLPFDPLHTVFVWSGQGDPFTKDDIGLRMMRFLILVAVRAYARAHPEICL